MKDPDTEMTVEERADLFERMSRFNSGDDEAVTREELEWFCRPENIKYWVLKPL